MKILSCLLLISLCFACACADKTEGKTEKAESRPTIAVIYSPVIDAFKEWSDRKSKEFSNILGIPEPAGIYVYYSIPDITSFNQLTGEVTYVKGRYFPINDTIVVWALDLTLTELTLVELQEVMIHEFYHYYLDVKGLPQPDGPHNEEFDRLTKEAGLTIK